MEDINITIPASQIEEAVARSIGTTFKDDLVNAVQDDMSNNLDQYISEDTILEMVREDMKNHIYYYVDEDDLHDLIDADNIADKVMDKIDADDIMSNYDFSGEIESLAEQYYPASSCRLAKEVTRIVKDAFIHLIKEDEEVVGALKGFNIVNTPSVDEVKASHQIDGSVIKFSQNELQKLISDVRQGHELPAHIRFFIS